MTDQLPLVVFDLDDTLSIVGDRADILKQDFPSEEEKWDTFFEACHQDKPNCPALLLLRMIAMSGDARVEIWTGRDELVRGKTEDWLSWHAPIDLKAYLIPVRMRERGDHRHDLEIKSEWTGKYGKPFIVFDDRNSMVQYWREQGILCCQVKESDF